MTLDGTTDTRWQADNEADDEWIQVDLGSVQAVNAVTINWEAAYAAKYEIRRVSTTDGKNGQQLLRKTVWLRNHIKFAGNKGKIRKDAGCFKRNSVWLLNL